MGKAFGNYEDEDVLGVKVAYDPKNFDKFIVHGPDMEKYIDGGGTKDTFEKYLIALEKKVCKANGIEFRADRHIPIVVASANTVEITDAEMKELLLSNPDVVLKALAKDKDILVDFARLVSDHVLKRIIDNDGDNKLLELIGVKALGIIVPQLIKVLKGDMTVMDDLNKIQKGDVTIN